MAAGIAKGLGMNVEHKVPQQPVLVGQ